MISAFASSSGAGPGHLKQSEGQTAVFAVADVDWLFDAASIEAAGTSAARPLNDNHALLTNMIDVASHDASMLQIRSRRNLTRRFTRVDALLTAARARFHGEEMDATAKIAKVEDTIARVVKAVKDSGAQDVPANIRGGVDKLKLGLLPVRRQLRETRRQIREDVESLGQMLMIANLAAGPTLTLIFATLVFRSRRRPGPP